jgi:capsular exopolysaccharide synthesis family protein
LSRIDEALRLAKGKSREEKPELHDQRVFTPAWTVSDEDVKETEPSPVEDTGQRSAAPAKRPIGILSFSSAWRERLAGGPDGNPGLIEQFRRLAATLHHAQQNNGIKTVMVTSASPGDGKTLTAVNLALVLAESYRYNVLLIDADLRRPSIPSVIDLSDGSGLSEALRSTNEQKLALVPITPKLTLLPAGQAIANSIEALTSPRMQHILDEASRRYDWVVLDAPPVGPTTDARLLTQMVGGTLFVIQAGKTQYADVNKAISALGRDQILGIVLNGVDDEPIQPYYGAAGLKD